MRTPRFKPKLTFEQLGVLAVDQVGEVSPVIQDHVEGLSVFEVNGLLDAPHVLLVCLALPCVHCVGAAYKIGCRQWKSQIL